MDQPKRCYLDCTDTFNTGCNTGIQRVVRNVVSRLEALEGFRGYRFIPVVTMSTDIFVVKGNLAGSFRATRAASRLIGATRNALDSLLGVKKQQDTAPLNAVDQAATRRVSGGVLERLHRAVTSACRTIIPLLLRRIMLLESALPGYGRVTLQKGDIYFFADSFWNVGDLHALHNARAQEARIILLIYDIIPVTHSAYFDELNCKKFVQMLPEYLRIVDGVISISRYTMDELMCYCQRTGIERDIPFDYFHLGADFSPAPVSEESDNHLLSDLGEEKFFLMVGTIEPRKNHDFVLDVFERLWLGGSDLKLCVVGKVGWKCKTTYKRMTSSRYLNERLFVFCDLSDSDLRYLMKRSCAVVIASIVEGFGLPLVEAMHFQKTVLASDIPVFREVGGNYPVYFPLDDDSKLSDLISRVAYGSLKSESVGKGWLSWDQSVRDLMGKVIGMAEGKDSSGEHCIPV